MSGPVNEFYRAPVHQDSYHAADALSQYGD